ncbi:hypothetical protein SLEP1_g41660 [Rubroshorea leprosula]|uniref:Uncharacterized protein n=1 Tax=Rubroshorea leprosula TaxID=152421 RepID=A0AAV5L7N7_9ROSI|nr:hypothetical protein SLEP1_g41660 [Rubroshorea leprosula]
MHIISRNLVIYSCLSFLFPLFPQFICSLDIFKFLCQIFDGKEEEQE